MADIDDRVLREAREVAEALRVDLTDEYLALIEAVEALPENQPRRQDASGSLPR
jgi:hypothetical protein